jgi:hypothetical protein
MNFIKQTLFSFVVYDLLEIFQLFSDRDESKVQFSSKVIGQSSIVVMNP